MLTKGTLLDNYSLMYITFLQLVIFRKKANMHKIKLKRIHFQLSPFSWYWLLNRIYQTTQAKVFLAGQWIQYNRIVFKTENSSAVLEELMWFLFPVDAFDRWLRPLWSISYLNHSLFSFTAIHRKYFYLIRRIIVLWKPYRMYLTKVLFLYRGTLEQLNSTFTSIQLSSASKDSIFCNITIIH